MRLLDRMELTFLRVDVPAAVLPWPEAQEEIWTSPLPFLYADAVCRLRKAEAEGLLGRNSSWHLARELHYLKSPGVAFARLRHSWKGFDLLRQLDEHSEETGVRVFVDALPLPGGDQRHYRQNMRLRDRLAELASLRAGVAG